MTETLAMKKDFADDYDTVLQKTVDALKTEGFGVLTEIDVKKTLKEKLSKDFKRYKILGACNPPLAFRALSSDDDVGLLLPCNVVVYEKAGGGSVVSIVNPATMVVLVDNPDMRAVAAEAKEKLERVLGKI